MRYTEFLISIVLFNYQILQYFAQIIYYYVKIILNWNNKQLIKKHLKIIQEFWHFYELMNSMRWCHKQTMAFRSVISRFFIARA